MCNVSTRVHSLLPADTIASDCSFYAKWCRRHCKHCRHGRPGTQGWPHPIPPQNAFAEQIVSHSFSLQSFGWYAYRRWLCGTLRVQASCQKLRLLATCRTGCAAQRNHATLLSESTRQAHWPATLLLRLCPLAGSLCSPCMSGAPPSSAAGHNAPAHLAGDSMPA